MIFHFFAFGTGFKTLNRAPALYAGSHVQKVRSFVTIPSPSTESRLAQTQRDHYCQVGQAFTSVFH